MPAGYGVPADTEGVLAWEWVQRRLAQSYNYWVCTTRPGGRPHAMPVWGVMVENTLVFSTSRESRKGRNMARNPEITVHLESGDDVVVLEGRVEDARDAALLAAADAAYAVKYVDQKTGVPFHISQDPSASDGVYALRPRVVLAWHESNFPRDSTRWTFPYR
jgi:hypothetical protein